MMTKPVPVRMAVDEPPEFDDTELDELEELVDDEDEDDDDDDDFFDDDDEDDDE